MAIAHYRPTFTSDSHDMSVFVELLYTTYAVVRAIFLSAVQALVGARQKDVRGEIVLITGSGSGLGRLLAVAFARRGAVVVGWDVNERANEETADIVRATGGLIHVYTCDVRYATVYIGLFEHKLLRSLEERVDSNHSDFGLSRSRS